MPVTVQACIPIISALNMLVNPQDLTPGRLRYAVAGSVAKVLRGLPVNHQPNDLDLLIGGLGSGLVGTALTNLVPGLSLANTEVNSVQSFKGTIALRGQRLLVDVLRVTNVASLEANSSLVFPPQRAGYSDIPAICCLEANALNSNIWAFSD